MNRALRQAFALLLRPLVALLLGPAVQHRDRLPRTGPAVIVANHNSHADVPLLISLFSPALQAQVRPIAAADYFLARPWLAWFATRVIGIVPLVRGSGRERAEVLGGCVAALERGEMLIFFPEGTRGEPERMAPLRDGIAWLAGRCPSAAIVPVFLRGPGRSLPRGAWLPLPICSDVIVGYPVRWNGDPACFMARLEHALFALRDELPVRASAAHAHDVFY